MLVLWWLTVFVLVLAPQITLIFLRRCWMARATHYGPYWKEGACPLSFILHGLISTMCPQSPDHQETSENRRNRSNRWGLTPRGSMSQSVTDCGHGFSMLECAVGCQIGSPWPWPAGRRPSVLRRPIEGSPHKGGLASFSAPRSKRFEE